MVDRKAIKRDSLQTMSLSDFHAWFAWLVVAANAAAGVWALAAAKKPQLGSLWLWRFTIGAQLTLFVQVILGVVLYQEVADQANDLHLFYGFIAIVAVAILFGYRQQLEKHIYLLYGFGGLFIMGLALRTIYISALTG